MNTFVGRLWEKALPYIKRIQKKDIILLFLAIIVGVLVGLASVALKYAIEKLLSFSFAAKGEVILGSLSYVPFYYILLIPAFGGLFVGLVKNYLFPAQTLGGVEQVMKSLALKQGRFSYKEILQRFVNSTLTLGTGGSAGKEGPVVHVGGGIGSFVARFFYLSDEYVKALVGSGAAAGIAAAFNAPIAGTFFAMEILLGDISLNIVSMLLVASISATMIGRLFQGEFSAFSPPIYEVSTSIEFVFYVLLGILAGYVCLLFIWSLVQSRSFFDRLKIPLTLKPALGGLLVGAMALVIPNILGVGYGTIDQLLHFEDYKHAIPFVGLSSSSDPHLYPWILLMAIAGILLGKILATSITLGSGGSGGTIVPALFLGATLGALVGHFADLLLPNSPISVGAFALIGMGSIIAGTTQAPIMAILLFFETTRSYQIILPVAIVSILSSQIVKYYLHGSMYTRELKQFGISLYEGMEKTVMSTLRVGDVMRTNLITVPYNMTLQQIMEIFLHTRFTTVIVVDQKKEILGKLHLDDLKRLVESPALYNVLIASEIMEKTEILSANDSLSMAVEILGKRHASLIPVISRHGDRKPVGYITRKDVLSAYQKEILRKSISGITFQSPVAAISSNIPKTRHAIDFSEDYTLDTIAATLKMIGKSLKDLQLRQRFGVTVLAVMSEDSDEHIVPAPDYQIKKGDVLVIAGKKDSVVQLSDNKGSSIY